MSDASPAWRGRYRQAARDAVFLLSLWPILLLAFLAVVPLIVLGVGTAVLGVGVPVLGLGLSVSSRFAEIGRRAVADVDSSEYIPGHYRRPGAGEQGARTLLAPLRDPQRWADLTWVVVGLVVSLATWALALVWITAALAAPRQMPASRLERDIHDGPQQRLVRLGMDLARAKRQTSRDPRAAETILDGAIAQTREALDELRGLSRGIAPPVLVDRGLAAALAEVAVRSGRARRRRRGRAAPERARRAGRLLRGQRGPGEPRQALRGARRRARRRRPPPRQGGPDAPVLLTFPPPRRNRRERHARPAETACDSMHADGTASPSAHRPGAPTAARERQGGRASRWRPASRTPRTVSCEQGPTARVGVPGRRLAILPRRPATAASRSAKRGGLPERPMGADCKSAAECYGGSNPSPATMVTGSSDRVVRNVPPGEHPAVSEDTGVGVAAAIPVRLEFRSLPR